MRKTKCRFWCIFLACILFLSALTGCAREKKATVSFFALDTYITVTVYGENADSLANECKKLCEYYEGLYSPSQTDSVLYRLNHRETDTVSEEVARLIRTGIAYSDLSEGMFDISVGAVSELWDFSSAAPSVPETKELQKALESVGYGLVHTDGQKVTFDREDTKLDLGALAKGAIADAMAAYLRQNGIKSALIDLGGNILCVGNKPDGTPFRVGIQEPEADSQDILLTVGGEDLSVVTSGNYQRFFEADSKRYHHILDATTGFPAENGLTSVTVLGKSSLQCDCLSTVCFLLGREKGMELIENTEDVEAIFITEEGEQLVSSGFAQWRQ